VYTDKLPLINPPPALLDPFQTQETEVGPLNCLTKPARP